MNDREEIKELEKRSRKERLKKETRPTTRGQID